MATFRDSTPQKREWLVDVTVDTIKRVRKLADVDLTKLADGDLLARLTDDPVLLADVLYAVCQPECESRDVSDEDFGRLLAGDVIDDASRALLAGMIAFFPKGKRAALQKMLDALDAMQAKMNAGIGQALDRELDAALDAAVELALSEFGSSLASLRGSSGLTPDPSRSAS